MFQILVVDDSKNTVRLMRSILKRDGYEVYDAENGANALDVLERQHIDLILLDVMMPVMNGYELTEHLRSTGNNTPVLMVSAKSLSEDICQGFLSGADDYMVKPVNEKEMLLRIKALLRRSQIANEHRLVIGEITLDYDSLTVSRNGNIQTLPKKEFQLLYTLLSYPNKIFTRQQLMDMIWGMDSSSTDSTLNVHVTRLRRRFEDWPEFKITVIRGTGYKAVIQP